MNKSAICFFMVILLLSSCVSKQQKENTINISGAFALYPLVIQWSEEYKKEHDEVRFNISAGGAGKGMADALAGSVDLGMFSREITPEEKAQGVWWVGLCKDAVLPTISAENPYLIKLKARGLTQAEFKAIFVDRTITNWNELLPMASSMPIEVFTRSDACGAAGTWANYLGGNQEDLKGIGIHGDPALAEVVSKNSAGIGFNNTIYIYNMDTDRKREGIEVIPIDINGNGKIDQDEHFYDSFNAILEAISEGIYPSPPARELYFVSKGKPTKKATRDFLLWTLSKGQKYVQAAGYVTISNKKTLEYQKKLEE